MRLQDLKHKWFKAKSVKEISNLTSDLKISKIKKIQNNAKRRSFLIASTLGSAGLLITSGNTLAKKNNHQGHLDEAPKNQKSKLYDGQSKHVKTYYETARF